MAVFHKTRSYLLSTSSNGQATLYAALRAHLNDARQCARAELRFPITTRNVLNERRTQAYPPLVVPKGSSMLPIRDQLIMTSC